MARYTPEAIQVIGLAQGEAQRLGFPFVQREQLFLGLIQDEAVGRILTAAGMDLDNTRQAVESRLIPGLGAPEDRAAIGLLPTAEQVYQHRAQTAAAMLGHSEVGPEHILLGFLLEQHGVVLEVLTEQGATKDKIMDVIKRRNMQRGNS